MQLNFTTFQNPSGIFEIHGCFIIKLVIFHSRVLNVVDSNSIFFYIYAYTEKLIGISLLCWDSRFGEINDHC